MRFVLLSAAVLCVAAALPGDDAATIAAQKPLYPLTTCPISGEPLGDKPVKMLYGTTLVEFCCKDCPGDFMKDPKPALAKIAAARAAKPAAPADKGAKATTPPAGGEHTGHGN